VATPLYVHPEDDESFYVIEVFLASDEATFITGAILPVDGGYLAQ
jgi:NAD(P)-dependent dehydrogenase (short-subunit alcohol dehydrogenase family)